MVTVLLVEGRAVLPGFSRKYGKSDAGDQIDTPASL